LKALLRWSDRRFYGGALILAAPLQVCAGLRTFNYALVSTGSTLEITLSWCPLLIRHRSPRRLAPTLAAHHLQETYGLPVDGEVGQQLHTVMSVLRKGNNEQRQAVCREFQRLKEEDRLVAERERDLEESAGRAADTNF